MEKVKGLILYNVELDGCLNGVYTNNYLGGVICNEIARRQFSNENQSKNEIEGHYDCFYFSTEKDSIRNNIILEIKRVKIEEITAEMKGLTLLFKWKNQEGKTVFEGLGYLMNPRQLVVSYVGF